MTRNPKIFLSAGEASGEHYGALLIAAHSPPAASGRFFGLGGQRMEALRLPPHRTRRRRGRHGYHRGHPAHAPHLRRIPEAQSKHPRSERPDVAILIDFPDVNLSLARDLHSSSESPWSTSSARSSGHGRNTASARSGDMSTACWSSSLSRSASIANTESNADFCRSSACRSAPAHHLPRRLRSPIPLSTRPNHDAG